MKQKIDAFDYAGHICKAMPKGILITTKRDGKVNSMTIGWGHIGIEWSRPVFVAYVRESRYTREMLDGSADFTINVPYGQVDPKILGFCGTKSGRDMDKIATLDLTPVDGEQVNAPGIKELPLTLECKILCKIKQEPAVIPEDIQQRYYLKDEQGLQDHHYAYYGQIVDAYIIQD